MEQQISKNDLLKLTVHLTSSYISNHKVDINQIESVLIKFKDALLDFESLTNETGIHLRRVDMPAVPIAESVTDDYIVCLEDGKKVQMLKRHLRSVYKMSIDQYRARWKLPPDYPSVCISYRKRRSDIAKGFGFGLSNRKAGKIIKGKIVRYKKKQNDS